MKRLKFSREKVPSSVDAPMGSGVWLECPPRVGDTRDGFQRLQRYLSGLSLVEIQSQYDAIPDGDRDGTFADRVVKKMRDRGSDLQPARTNGAVDRGEHDFEGYAALVALDLERRGLVVRVCGSAEKHFVIEVACDALDLELAKLSSGGLSLREWLAESWKRGLNPRVFNPYLPHGLEDRLGVTYQGKMVPVGGSGPDS